MPVGNIYEYLFRPVAAVRRSGDLPSEPDLRRVGGPQLSASPDVLYPTQGRPDKGGHDRRCH